MMRVLGALSQELGGRDQYVVSSSHRDSEKVGRTCALFIPLLIVDTEGREVIT